MPVRWEERKKSDKEIWLTKVVKMVWFGIYENKSRTIGISYVPTILEYKSS